MSMIMQWARVGAAELPVIVTKGGDEFFEWYEGRLAEFLDVDKAWHAIHAVLTGTAWSTDHPLAGVVLGGTEFGEDVGYGPPRFLTPSEVAVVAQRLAAVTVEDFTSRIDLERLAALDVYPDVWGRPDERDMNVEYVRDGFAAVRALFLAAAGDGDGMVVLCT